MEYPAELLFVGTKHYENIKTIVLIANKEEFCWAMRVEMSFFKSSLSLHSLKIWRALHAASFNWLTRIRPAAPDAVIDSGISRHCRECPVFPLSSSCFVGGVAKDSAIRRSSRLSSAMAFWSFKTRFKRYSLVQLNLQILLTSHWC